jgi:hypothetical protein
MATQYGTYNLCSNPLTQHTSGPHFGDTLLLAQTGCTFKGTVSRDFLLLVFFMNQFPLSPRVFHLDRFEFSRKFAEIFASQGAPPVSTTLAKMVQKLPPVSATPAANLPPVSLTPVANNGNNIRLQIS